MLSLCFSRTRFRSQLDKTTMNVGMNRAIAPTHIFKTTIAEDHSLARLTCHKYMLPSFRNAKVEFLFIHVSLRHSDILAVTLLRGGDGAQGVLVTDSSLGSAIGTEGISETSCQHAL